MSFEDASSLFVQDDEPPERPTLFEDASSEDEEESKVPASSPAPSSIYWPRAKRIIIPRSRHNDRQADMNVRSPGPIIAPAREEELRTINNFMSAAMTANKRDKRKAPPKVVAAKRTRIVTQPIVNLPSVALPFLDGVGTLDGAQDSVVTRRRKRAYSYPKTNASKPLPHRARAPSPICDSERDVTSGDFKTTKEPPAKKIRVEIEAKGEGV